MGKYSTIVHLVYWLPLTGAVVDTAPRDDKQVDSAVAHDFSKYWDGKSIVLRWTQIHNKFTNHSFSHL